MEEDTENFFEKHKLAVEMGQVEVGETYPLYGMLTEFLTEEEGKITVTLNFQIKLVITMADNSKVATLKERAFEPGIFVCTFTSKDPLEADCTTVIFGRKQGEMN